jgi:hypothetical protein
LEAVDEILESYLCILNVGLAEWIHEKQPIHFFVGMTTHPRCIIANNDNKSEVIINP